MGILGIKRQRGWCSSTLHPPLTYLDSSYTRPKLGMTPPHVYTMFLCYTLPTNNVGTSLPTRGSFENSCYFVPLSNNKDSPALLLNFLDFLNNVGS